MLFDKEHNSDKYKISVNIDTCKVKVSIYYITFNGSSFVIFVTFLLIPFTCKARGALKMTQKHSSRDQEGSNVVPTGLRLRLFIVSYYLLLI